MSNNFWHLPNILLILLLCSSLHAQDPAHWQLTDEDGLPSLTVYKILQDNAGYMWMGTSNGICRYDGKEFKYFSMDQLKDRNVLEIDLDPFGRIWFANLAGQLFKIVNNEIVVARNENNEPIEGVHDFIWNDHHLYIYFSRGIYRSATERHLKRYFLNAKDQLIQPFLVGNFYKFSGFVKIENQINFFSKDYEEDPLTMSLQTININSDSMKIQKIVKPWVGFMSTPVYAKTSNRSFFYFRLLEN